MVILFIYVCVCVFGFVIFVLTPLHYLEDTLLWVLTTGGAVQL